MLHALNDHGPGLVLDVDQPLHAQQIGAAQRRQQLDAAFEGCALERFVEPQRERHDVVRMTVRVFLVMIVIAVMIGNNSWLWKKCIWSLTGDAGGVRFPGFSTTDAPATAPALDVT